MDVPIKFRGKTLCGAWVFGDFISRGPEAGRPGIIDEQDFYHEVDANTVKQLVCFDKYGNEVYDGDSVIDGFGAQYLARLSPTTQDIAGSFDFVPYPPDFVLKENQQ